MPRLEPKVITGTPAAFLQGAQLWAVQTAIELLPGVFHGGPRGPTPGQQLRLAEAGYVRQETRGGRFPLVTWLTPTGQVIGNEAARGVAHDLPRTPGINPTVPSSPPASSGSDLDALLRNRTFVPRGGTVTSAPPSDFDRLIIGRTYNPPDLPPRNTRIGTAAGTLPALADFFASGYLDRVIAEFHARLRKGPQRRSRVRGRSQRRAAPWPDSVRPPSLPPPTPAEPAQPKLPSPARRQRESLPLPSAQRQRPAPRSTVAENYRVPAPSAGSVTLPRPRSVPAAAGASSSRALRRSLLDPLVGLLGLPLLSSPTSSPRNFAPPQFSTPQLTATPQLSFPDPRPLTQFQTQPLPSGSSCDCGPKPTRTRAKKCTNPIVSKRTRGNLQIITRRLECP